MEGDGGGSALSEASLTRIYGHDKAKLILQYIADFRQYECNFPAVTPNIHEANGRPLLLLSCPVLFRREDGEYRITIAVGFTQQFPDRPPHCAVLLNPGERLRSDHPIVAPNGSVRLVQLPGVGTEPHPSLCSILLAIIDAFEHDFPLLPPGPTQPAAPLTPSTPPSVSPVSGSPMMGGGSTATTSGSPGVPAAALQEAQERVLLDLRRKGDEYLALREAVLLRMQHLETSRAALKSLEGTLAEKKRLLLEIKPDVVNLHAMITEWKSSGEMADTDACIVPADSLHAQAMELLADVQTSDDTLELLDSLIGKELISCDEYLKRVSGVARKQFMAKYMLKKATGQIAAAANIQSLMKRFPIFDEAMVREVLQTCGYDVGQAAAQLSQMSGS